MREAPSLTVIQELTRRGARVRAYDPVATHEAKKVLAANAQVEFVADMYDAVDGADGLLLVTEWKAFRAPDFERIRSLLKSPLILDGRNQYNAADLKELGFDYEGIGRT
jgi:UDPglucose 6-dehydrogenase